MRIVHFICGPGAGGAEILVKDMVIEMAGSGHDLHIVFLQTATESGRDERFGAIFLEELSSAGVTYDFIGAKSRKNPLLGFISTRKIVKKFRPDIVHAHLYWPLFFLFSIWGVPVVFTKHSVQLGAPSLLIKLLLCRATAFVAICEACKNKFASVAGRKLVKIDNGTSFRLNKNPKNKGSTVKLLYVGRLYSVKNISLILRSCAENLDLNFQLTIAGEGPEMDALRSLSESLGIKERVIFLGNVDEIYALMKDSDIFVLSSYSEGLPISLIEASMAGLPCLVTDVGGCGEVVKRCNNGFVVPVNNELAYSRKLRELIINQSLRHQFSSNGLKFSSHYSIDRVVSEHLSLYESIL